MFFNELFKSWAFYQHPVGVFIGFQVHKSLAAPQPDVAGIGFCLVLLLDFQAAIQNSSMNRVEQPWMWRALGGRGGTPSDWGLLDVAVGQKENP